MLVLTLIPYYVVHMLIYSVWKSLKEVSSFWSITFITFLSLHFSLAITFPPYHSFPYCHYIPLLLLHPLIVITFPPYHSIPLLSLHSLTIITFPSYYYTPNLSLHPPHLITTFPSYFDNFNPSYDKISLLLWAISPP